MSDFIGHECGLAAVRLRQPLSYYREQHDDPTWGIRRLLLLMEKQRNRGQDGAGVAVVKFDMPPGDAYLKRVRSDKENSLNRIFEATLRDMPAAEDPVWTQGTEVDWKSHSEFLGEAYIGHLRYATHADNSIANCHPRVRKHNVASRAMAVAGNFNMTNSGQLFRQLHDIGLNLVGDSDTQVVLERLGYSLDREHAHLEHAMGPGSFHGLEDRPLAEAVSEELDLTRMLTHAAQPWDGGYVFTGILGNGDMFICRDPSGIRPAFFYLDEEVFAAASERAALVNVFDTDPDNIEELKPGHAVVVKRNGTITQHQFAEPLELRRCTFERIYFSRGNDRDIYRERKALGHALAPRVLSAINGDVDHTVFSFVPNTAEIAYLGLIEELEHLVRDTHAEELWNAIQSGNVDRAEFDRLMNGRVRAEKVAHKDQKLRTFITGDSGRRDLVMHVYDITRGSVTSEDTLVVLDDSIVRGTTLRESIITILSRLEPKKIIIVSSAPPIMYPDCYGIDMSQLGRFIAFEAAIELLREHENLELLDEIEAKCAEQADLDPSRMVNHVAMLYDQFSLEQISAKIAQLIRPKHVSWKGDIQVIYQDLPGLRGSMPGYTGDWYFTGNYPTPGGFRVLNTAFLNWRRNIDSRSY